MRSHWQHGLRFVIAAALLTVSVAAGVVRADQQMPEMPKPGPENAWLQKMVGQWEAETEAKYAPDQPAVKSKGSESIKAVGGFWIMDEVKGEMMGQPFTGVMALGYDPNKEKYVGTWIDSMTGKLWEYEGQLDEETQVLTLESEGECPMKPGEVTSFRETIELKGKNEKVFTSYMQKPDGEWVTTMTSRAKRTK